MDSTYFQISEYFNSSKLVMLLTCVTINAISSYMLDYHYILLCHIKHKETMFPLSSCVVGFFEVWKSVFSILCISEAGWHAVCDPEFQLLN
jgi:hypothetical protein